MSESGYESESRVFESPPGSPFFSKEEPRTFAGPPERSPGGEGLRISHKGEILGDQVTEADTGHGKGARL